MCDCESCSIGNLKEYRNVFVDNIAMDDELQQLDEVNNILQMKSFQLSNQNHYLHFTKFIGVMLSLQNIEKVNCRGRPD